MPTIRSHQSSFAAGLIGRRLRGRSDLQQYPAGAEELLNVRVLTSGAATRRPGSYFVAAPPGRCRLVPFRVSSEVAYVLSFGAGTLRFMRNRAPLLNASAVPVEIATPYGEADLATLRFAQSADTLYIFHPSLQPRRLYRTAADAFELALVTLVQGPYGTENFGDVAPAPPAATVSDPEDTAPPPDAGGTGTGAGPDPRDGNVAEGGGANGGGGEGAGGTEWGGGEQGGESTGAGGDTEAESESTGGGTTGLEG